LDPDYYIQLEAIEILIREAEEQIYSSKNMESGISVRFLELEMLLSDIKNQAINNLIAIILEMQ
jgi:hypothetical protein